MVFVFISECGPRRGNSVVDDLGVIVERLVYLMETIMLHERLDHIAPQFSSVEWCELRLLLTVFDPSMYVQRKLESDKVTGTLVVPLIWDIRTSLADMLDGLQEPAPTKTGQTSRRHEPCSSHASRPS